MRERERKQISQPLAYLLMALIIIGVVSFGLLAVNQFLKFKFTNRVLMDPCGLCEEKNPHLKICFSEASKVFINKETGEIETDPKIIYPITYPQLIGLED